MAHRKVSALVIGLPANMDGTEGPRAQSCRAFARNLERLRPVNIAFWDERLSTSAVERFLIEDLDLNRKRRAQVVDRTAAGPTAFPPDLVSRLQAAAPRLTITTRS